MRLFILPAVALALAGVALAQNPTPLTCGVAQAGSVDAISPIQRYSFTVTEPNDPNAIRFVSTSTDPSFAVLVTLYDPHGTKVIAQGTSVFSGFDGILQEPGDYQIEVRSDPAGKSGTFRVTRVRLKGCSDSVQLTCGATVKAQIGAPGVINSQQFTGQRGDKVLLRMVNTTKKITTDDLKTSFALLAYDVNGALMTILDGKPASVQSTTYIKLDMTLPADGTYTFLVFEYSNGIRTGTYSMVALRLNGGCRGSKTGTCGTTVQSTLADPLTVDSYTVPAQAGDLFLIRRALTNATNSKLRLATEIYDPSGKPVQFDSISNASRIPFTATAAGAYTVLFSDDLRYDGTQTGSYAAFFARLNNPCNAQPLGCGNVADSRIDGTLRFSSYSIAAAAGDAFLVRLMRTDATTGFKPRAEIYDPQGHLASVGATTDLAELPPFRAPAAGTYTVLVGDGTDGTRSGGFSISNALLNRPCNTTALDCKSLVTGSISGPLRFSTYSYTAQAGDSFTVRMLDPNATFTETLKVYDAQGNPAGSPVPGNVQGWDVARPGAGTYTILAMDGGKTPGQGAFALQFFRTRNACAAAPQAGASTGGVITGPAPFSAYSLPVAAGDSLLARSAALSDNFTATMDLYDTDGARVGSGTFALNSKAKADGAYTLIVSASSPRTTGAYALSWQLLNRPIGATPLSCGQTLGGTLSPGAQFRYYTAPADSGDTLRLLLSRLSDNFGPQIELFDPAGSRLSLAPSDISRRVGDSGSYLVLISPGTVTSETGAYALAFQRPNRACAAVPLGCGQSVLGTLGVPGKIDALVFSGNAGDRAVLRVAPRTGTVSPYVELYDQAGALLQSGALTSLTRALPSTGSFALLVRDRAGTGTGTYRVSLQHDPNACPTTDTAQPTVRLRRPTGGEVIAGGSPFRIQWESDDNVDVVSHEIRLSTDGGMTWAALIAAGLSGATQSYDWQVPANIAPSRSAMIRLTATDAAGNSATASSDLLTLIGSGFEDNTTVTYEYDALNRVTKATYQDGLVAQYIYDANGNLTAVQVAKP